jgi:hypothetical protein
MQPDVTELGTQTTIDLCDADGRWRDPVAVAAEVAGAPASALLGLASPAPLDAARAAALFRALAPLGRRFALRLSLAALESRSLSEEAARAGCAALHLEREGVLRIGLASGLDAASGDCDAVVTALRRARGLGMATILELPVGLPDDDEGVFERAVRFCRRALVAVPVVRTAVPGDAVAPGSSGGSPRMDPESLDNGVRWARWKLTRHGAIWRRALWPAGSRRIALGAGYRQRRALSLDRDARYTPTMQLLRALNRTARARARRFLAISASAGGGPLAAPRRAWLRTKAASDARLRSLVIHVEGALDLRGARSISKRVRQALAAGYQRVTIDVHGIEAVSPEVVTRFLAENRARLAEAAGRVRIENLRGKLEALRSQLGDLEGLRLLESATSA